MSWIVVENWILLPEPSEVIGVFTHECDAEIIAKYLEIEASENGEEIEYQVFEIASEDTILEGYGKKLSPNIIKKLKHKNIKNIDGNNMV